MTGGQHESAEVKLLKTAFILSIITIVYNVGEGLFSTLFGYGDDTLALFGFGVDSFVEVISGIGIGHMVWRMRRSPVSERDRFERRALYITGVSFFLLAAGLVIGSALAIISGARPDTTIAGIVISAVSIITMWFLYSYKLKTGRALDSAPIIADANCTKTCFYLSFILLGSSVLYELFRISYLDIAGSLGIAWFAFSEGKESIEKARSNSLTCSCHDCDV
ncbi:MAG TPA: cation transporter [Spirochaetota bacterium]|nr:cation transporter [Spirochaetota bacterium]HPC39997.1 cation transporter [Spirochaetota bacterium]HPL16622.1 cation transporter [Spirochaetota bacterium]HQF09814.1 cation transporter [Spirochaetota bacterium]HQH98742.1 cation transporter [Spirochaetota bacterium]